MVSRQTIVDTARQYINTPFHHQGRVKGVGIDCVGLLICIARDLEIEHYDVQGYARVPSGDTFEKHILGNGLTEIPEIEVGAVLLMSFDSDPQHVAVCSTENSIIHAYYNVRKCVEHDLDESWRAKIKKIYRFKDVE